MKTPLLRLEFAPGARHVSAFGVAALLVCAVLFGRAAFELGQLLAANARQVSAIAALQARRDLGVAKARPAAPNPGEIARARAVRQVSQNLITPWADLLESLESAPSESVALLSVEPSVGKRSVRLTAEARSAADMLAYLRALQRDSRLASVVLLSHEVQARLPGAPVRFQIQAAWGMQP